MTTLARDRAALRRLADGVIEAPGDVGPLIRRGTRLLLLVLWALSLFVAGVSAWLLLHHAEEHTRSTAVSLEQFAQRTITLAAFVVDEYEEALNLRGGAAGVADDPAARQRLGELTRWLPAGSVGGFVLPDGTLAVSTIPTPSPPPRLNDRRWFAAVMQEGRETYIGPALQGRVNKNFFFTYSAAYRGGDGKIAGAINLGIPSDSITGLAPDQHTTKMALVQHEGPVVAALPFSPDLVGKVMTLSITPPEGETTVFARVLGAFSVVTVRNIPSLALYAVVALPLADVLAPLFWGLAIGLPLLVLVSLLLLTLSNQLQAKSQQVEQALSDNKVLFQEVHHRVKNNLQVVSSLLRLQTERLPPELRPLLDETGARVRAIALVHEQIYRTASPSDVQLDRFLAQLVQQLSASMIGGTAKITTELQPVTIGLDRAVPVAILATEAITNAIKHGLDKGEGAIRVSLASRDGRNLIEVRDSGSAPQDGSQPGLGTRIMTALARQIDGEWSLDQSPAGGMVYSLSWPA